MSVKSELTWFTDCWIRDYSRAGGHLGTRRGVADARAILLLLVNNADEMPEITVMLDDLMGNPLSMLNCLGPGTKGHEVALDDVFRVGRVNPCWQGPWQII